MNQPYTYLIGWSDLQKYYYGVRYAKDCKPSDLWVTYFTSSHEVHKMVESAGAPDIVVVRRIFNNMKSARLWEHKVLQRMSVVQSEHFLNRNDRMAPPIQTKESLANSRSHLKGDSRTDAQKRGSQVRAKKMKGKAAHNMKEVTIFGKTYKSGAAARKALGLSFSQVQYYLHSDIDFKSADELKCYIRKERADNISKSKTGTKWSEEQKEGIRGRTSPRKGRVTSAEHKQKLSEAGKARQTEIVSCPHCNKAGGVNTMYRWHFDNCKVKVR